MLFRTSKEADKKATYSKMQDQSLFVYTGQRCGVNCRHPTRLRRENSWMELRGFVSVSRYKVAAAFRISHRLWIV